MFVKEIMTRDVITVSPDSSLKETGEILKEKRISGAPVVDNNGNIVGIVTITDLLRILDRIYRVKEVEKRDMGLKLSEIYEKQKSEAKVRDIMTKHVFTVSEDGTMDDIMKIMFGSTGVHTIPVIKDGKLVGIIGKRDLVYSFF